MTPEAKVKKKVKQILDSFGAITSTHLQGAMVDQGFLI